MNDWVALGQFALNGLFTSSVYALVSLGLVIVFGVMKIGDFAQGAFYVLSSYLVFTVEQYAGLPYGIAALLAVAVIAAISWANGQLVYLPLRRVGIGQTFIGALGVLLVVISVLTLIFGTDAQTVASPWGSYTIRLGGIAISAQKALVIGAALVLIGVTAFLLRYTRWGKALRALSQNEEAAALTGVNPAATRGLAFVWAGVLVGVAGALMAPVWPFEATSGTLLVLKAFAITVIGMGRVRGVLLGALLVGLSETMVQAYWSAQFSDLIPFALLALVMLLRPQALGPDEGRSAPGAHQVQQAIRWPGTVYLALAAGLLVLLSPWWAQMDNFWLHLLILMGLNVIMVSSLDLLTGYAGIPSLAHAGFWGIGAYSYALLMMRWGWPFPAALLGAASISSGAALVVSLVGLRLRQHWTSFTFIVGVIITMLLTDFETVTGGPNGLIGVPAASFVLPGLGPIILNPFRDKLGYFYLVLALVLLVLWIKRRIVRSHMGQALVALREDEGLAQAVGVPTERYKVGVFVISCGLTGIAGGLFASYLTYLNPQFFTFEKSFNLLVMNLVGGSASLLGPVIGPAALTLFAEWTHAFNQSIAEIIFGLLLIWTLIYLPGGLIAGSRRIMRKIMPLAPASLPK